MPFSKRKIRTLRTNKIDAVAQHHFSDVKMANGVASLRPQRSQQR
jgi:hypothetical protein